MLCTVPPHGSPPPCPPCRQETSTQPSAPPLGREYRRRCPYRGEGPPARPPGETRGWMTAEERRFILWAFLEQWTAARIGRALRVNEATVRRFRKTYWRNPSVLLELALFEMVGTPKNDEYRCLVCSDRVLGRAKVEEHVMAHYVLDPRSTESKTPQETNDNEGGDEESQAPRPTAQARPRTRQRKPRP